MRLREENRAFFKAMISIALPIALQNLLATTASMVDTIMIGSEGELAVAAVGICSQISTLFFAIYLDNITEPRIFATDLRNQVVNGGCSSVG